MEGLLKCWLSPKTTYTNSGDGGSPVLKVTADDDVGMGGWSLIGSRHVRDLLGPLGQPSKVSSSEPKERLTSSES